MKKDGTGWDPGSTECAVRKCAGKGSGSLENQKSTASRKVSEDKVSRRSSCVQFYRETEGSQDWEIVMGFVVRNFWESSCSRLVCEEADCRRMSAWE